ncbi:type 1 glutamine amidotransferase [Peribacillus saganii]|uniref:Type 1 glutamine amidotransferase n=1 Tax=Peribacillus saganii TaxID=2303992 RepID=A0A372LL28_9BACI|nr:type 1 glutamine amidotransferase [Peribacillus saganii]RFU67499.1 type 1 glutamine amidotransferase [Peribacillus saganii]
MKIHYIQNDPLATLGNIEEWLSTRNHALSCTKMYDNETLPSLDSFDMLIILGGRMGAYEEDKYPWLLTEKQFIYEAIKQGKWVLGICLGIQMLASALGSKVYPHAHQEIGWWPIKLTEEVDHSELFKGIPKSFVAFEHHGDTFDLPEGACCLAVSKGCRNQAFSYGERVIGLQFHPEFTEQVIEDVLKNTGRQLPSGEYVQETAYWTNQAALLEEAKSILFTVLDNIEKAAMKATANSKLSL